MQKIIINGEEGVLICTVAHKAWELLAVHTRKIGLLSERSIHEQEGDPLEKLHAGTFFPLAISPLNR
jgi:hypothetical protein